jgi:hypothetical protein
MSEETAKTVDVEKSLAFIRKNARDYAVAKSDRVYLEQFRKSKKAILMLEAERSGIKTGQERESYAYAHEDYIQLLTALQIAVEKEEYLKLMIAGCQLKIELYRTAQANMRAERHAYGA